MRLTKLSLTLAALFLLLAIGTSLPAAADDASSATGSAGSGASYQALTPADWGFAISLDSNGTLSQPGDADWSRDDLDFLWLSSYGDDAKYPIYQVDGSTIGKDDKSTGTVLSDDEFNQFFDSMTQELTSDKSFKILQSSRGQDMGGRTWQVFNVEETQPDKVLDYYSFFAHDTDGRLRLVNVYYNPPDDGSVFNLASTMLAPPAQ
jgi:hypothetical protein